MHLAINFCIILVGLASKNSSDFAIIFSIRLIFNFCITLLIAITSSSPLPIIPHTEVGNLRSRSSIAIDNRALTRASVRYERRHNWGLYSFQKYGLPYTPKSKEGS
ncbi:uncharacterized protein MELLADRAFT_106871 [Melampsora larici-populina 98AG31]|uniref:Uncharacterized protein n=1 Tax=Melampsora larici-populina (strain 98AG31 / pathotype 3-4-7) TaxID=747676 RepID=F4RMX7_MELLP|nr:uncharacterized protein MELLADRAFT_106871 [Melampsora larici-populina 98AG31]EGG06193.1 hypothetical protein MELLADRAFT_106871 [Melampsora larici-populina 98AG31]